MPTIPELAAQLRNCLPDTQILGDANSLIVRPQNIEQIQKCYALADKYGFRFKLQSQGKNWGYTQPADGGIMLDLSLLNKIVDFDEKLAYIVIEPGVTFQQVYEFLKAKNSNLMMPVTGGPPEGSVLATTLARGVAKGLPGDLFNSCCNLQVILPSGELLYTGLGQHPNAKAQNVQRWGYGPALDGLFSQSSYGIVTRMTFWLVRKPAYHTFVLFTLKDHGRLAPFVETIRDLKMSQLMAGNFLLANPYRILTQLAQYPWNITSETPLPKPILHQLMQQAGLSGEWTGQALLGGASKKLVAAQRAYIEQALASSADELQFVAQEELPGIEKRFKVFAPWLSLHQQKHQQARIHALKHSAFLGEPITESLASMYWRKKTPIPAQPDPNHDRCGVLWFNAVIPLDGVLIRQAVQLAEKILIQHTFEPNLGLNFITERVVYLVGVILYDPEAPGEAAKAQACHHMLMQRFAVTGLYPYRVAPNDPSVLPTSFSRSSSQSKRF